MKWILASAFVMGVLSVTPSYAQSLKELAEDCEDGDKQACNEIIKVLNEKCLDGSSKACRLLAQITGNPRSGGYSDERPSYKGDPFSGTQRKTLDDTNDYIRSKCRDPKMAAQLRAFGYCN